MRFNPEKRKSLLRALRSGTNQRRLAARYGVDQATISKQIDLAIKEKLAGQNHGH
jgi:transposase-like protein